MSSYQSTIAEAVKTAIAAASLSQSVQVRRVFVPEKDYSEVKDPICEVFVRSTERSQLSRQLIRRDIEINVVYATRLSGNNPQDVDDLDPLLQLQEELADVIRPGAVYGGAPCLRVETDPVYDVALLRESNVFAALIKQFFLYT